ncbi:MAG TPA: 30S ribosome-binding factor RbfA [Planctomycetaceae bacterium]|nr:30S ribosome-binding factor RbfA [Planctomycetaceae bacterium]
MASRRLLKAAEAIREVVSMAILTEIRDPRVQHVTVTGVEVAPDMRSAKVLVSVMGDEGKQILCLRGLANSAGFLQSKVAKRIDTRYTPRLTFELDQGVKKSLEVGKILFDLAQERRARQTELSQTGAAEGSSSPPAPVTAPSELQDSRQVIQPVPPASD